MQSGDDWPGQDPPFSTLGVGIAVDEEQALRERFWHPQTGQVVLDVGCFHGSWSLPALRAGATVHAFDANPDALELLRTAADAENLTDRLVCVQAAVGREYPADLADQIPEMMRPRGPWVTVDEYARDLRVDWLKVDVEGGELAVLETAREVLERDRPRLMVELHHLVYRVTDRWGVVDLLHDVGYRVTSEVLEGYERRPVFVTAEPI